MADSFVDQIVGTMAGWVVGPIMDKIINACFDYVKDQYRWQTGMKEELERLREIHPKVQAVFSASTQVQISDRDPALNSWIWQLRDAIDEADDVLDDFEYMKFEEEQQERNIKETKVRSSVNNFFFEPAPKLRRVCERALKKDPILERLETVVKNLDNVSAEVSTFLHLIDNAKQEQQELDLQLSKKRKTGCSPENDLIGRGEEKDFVMRWLSHEDPTHIASSTLYKNISLLSIVGHGGMGKTALLQHIYADLKEKFQLKMWVCVSKDFDAEKVIADMLEFINQKRPRMETLAALKESLKDDVQSKKFLLVLDDIWEEDISKWENVLSPLASGSFGSKILITTRMDSVASTIAKVIKKKKETLRIKGLKEDVCLNLLNTHAFANVENLGAHTKLTYIASSIVKKLSGSPLAAKIIGGVLNSNLNERFWMNILNSTDLLKVETEPGHNNILPILKLSFTFLPQALKNCFAFCGIFQQDHEFDKDDLVRMWIALGFIQKSSNEEETLEDIGGMYFDILARKSFFDEFQNYKRIYYKMHDLLHNLAQSISSEECFRFVGDNTSSFKIPKNVRHLFVKTKNPEVFTKIKDAKNLHSLFLTDEGYGQCPTEILAKIFETSRMIRLLFIHSSWQNMSKAIENLKHLRYLNLSVSFTQMPSSPNSLYHLRFIIYKKHVYVNGPCCDDFLFGDADVGNLSNLRYLELLPNMISSVPGIGKLKSLQELNEFNVKNEDGYRIRELEHMSELRRLKINFLGNVNDAVEARNAKLFEKRKLTDLLLNWGNTVNPDMGVGSPFSRWIVAERKFAMGDESLRNIFDPDLDANVLENLEPNENLKILSIFSYKGVRSAEWMFNAGLSSNLEYIRLDECSEWETLPPFGQLPRLKSLYLCNMPKVKQLDNKFHGNDEVSVFPSLEVLHMEGLQVLEDWFDGATTYDCFFPCLTKLFLDNCPNLQELPYLPPKLKKMQIYSIGWKALNFKQGTSKSIPLETLEVRSCPNITSLFSLGGLQQVESGIEESLQSLPSYLERLSSLKFLSVAEVPQLQQLPHIPASLEVLHLINLKSLQCLPSSLSAISSLKLLWLYGIPLLKSLPELPSYLDSLFISGCHPELMERYKESSGSDWHKIARIPSVRID